jgi:predicted flap endonuclease-1-like 5' DNA nuclease
MTYFILQSLLLIAVAYLLGAIIGCWLRKVFKKSASMLHTEADELPSGSAIAATAAGMVSGAVLGRELVGEEGEASIKINRADVSSQQAVGEPVEALEGRETITFIERETVVTRKKVAPEAAPAAAVDVSPQRVIREIFIPAVPEIDIAPVVQPVAEPIIDDLTRIKGVGLPVALELKRIGITRFEQVAAWTEEDIAEVSEKLGFSGRIERENWMDQAKILASGSELEFTTHQLREAERHQGGVEVTGKSDQSQTATKTTTTTTTKTMATTAKTSGKTGTVVEALHSTILAEGDDLKRIIGIGTNIEYKLKEIGITRYAQIAAWTSGEIAAVNRRLGVDGRIEREQWVEQAKQLDASGGGND